MVKMNGCAAIDPNSTDSDMAGIKNWFNEWYSKDTSRKIRAVNKAKGERGERLTTNVPYGYKHDSSDPKKWVMTRNLHRSSSGSLRSAWREKGRARSPPCWKRKRC